MSMDYIRYNVWRRWRGAIAGEHNSRLKIKMLSGYNRRVFFVHPLDEKLEYVKCL